MAKTKKETLKALGKKIKKLRTGLDLTQQELADQLNISRVYVGFIEQGREYPSLKLLMKMARKFKTRVEDLFSR